VNVPILQPYYYNHRTQTSVWELADILGPGAAQHHTPATADKEWMEVPVKQEMVSEGKINY
jgi:hypothetical protein